MYLRTPQGLALAIRDARAFRARHGHGLTYARNVASDGAFNFSVWRGRRYIGVLVPTL